MTNPNPVVAARIHSQLARAIVAVDDAVSFVDPEDAALRAALEAARNSLEAALDES